jgi:hypothetical protein
MDTITRDDARRRIVELGLPQVVLDAFDGRELPDVLELVIREPYELFAEPTHLADYPPGRIVPLFSDGSGYTVYALRESGEPRGYLRFGLEEVGEPPWDEGLSWADLARYLLIKIWEASEDDEAGEADVREGATLLAYEPVDALVEELRAETDDAAS